MITKALISLGLFALPAFASAERSITCELYSAVDSARLIETRVITQSDDGPISMTAETNGAPQLISSVGETVLLTHTNNNSVNGSRFSTLVLSSTYRDEVYTPVTWLIDWEKPGLRYTFLAAETYEWAIFDRYSCQAGLS